MQLSKLRGRRKHKQKDFLLHKWSQSQSFCSICVLFKILCFPGYSNCYQAVQGVYVCAHDCSKAVLSWQGQEKHSRNTVLSARPVRDYRNRVGQDCLLDGYENKHYKLLRASCITVFDFNHITTGSSGKGSTTLCSVFL